MAATTKTWVNNNLPQCEDDDLNGFKNENNNLIEGSGQTLSTADQQQTHKAVVQYSTDGDFYSDSGVANAYVLSALSSKASPHSLTDGMRVRFIAANANTGASTINVAGLGSKNIKLPDGSDPAAGDISSRVSLVFDSANDWFELQIATESQRGIIELATQAETSAGTDDTKAITPLTLQKKVNHGLVGNYDVILAFGSYISGNYTIPSGRTWDDYDLITIGGDVTVGSTNAVTNSATITKEAQAAFPNAWVLSVQSDTGQGVSIAPTSSTQFNVVAQGTDALRYVIGYRKEGVA